MKKQVLMSILVACVAMTSHARIWRVNNNAGVNANFTSLIDAIAAASNDDIIYVEPSPINYDPGRSIDVNKRLTIIGNGSFLSQHSGLQVNSNDSKLDITPMSSNGNLFFINGSSGSKVYGIWANAIGVDNGVDNITIQRCRTSGSIVVLGTCTNITIMENWATYIRSEYGPYGGSAVTNLTIKNNIVLGVIEVKPNDVNVLIENNTVTASFGIAMNLNNNANIVVTNNILLSLGGGPPAVVQGANATYFNNIAHDSSIPSGNGNQLNVAPSTLFNNLSFTFDGDAQLKAGSPAIDMGLNGSGDDIGAFNNGINRPTFILGLIPPYPTIYTLTVPNVVTTSSMNVTISTKSNN
jgi:hypothetical protein